MSLTLLLGCKNDDNETPEIPGESMYFPAISDSMWETRTPESAGWNTGAIQLLKDYLIQKNTKSFMVLVNGRIVMEEYFAGHTSTTTWPWNSAGKTLVATTTGIAQQEGLLSINDKASQYLGVGWTSEPLEKENLITSRHLLTMTSGLNDSNELIRKATLTYMADAGTRWSYHNVFQKLMDVVAGASKQDFESYFNTKLKNKIGISIS